MRNLFIQLDNYEAVHGKKEFLSAQINMLELLKSLKNYKNWRRRELILKTKFKAKLTNFKKKIRELNSELPRETEEVTIKELEEASFPAKESFQEIKNRKDIEVQLQEIREKLAKLG